MSTITTTTAGMAGEIFPKKEIRYCPVCGSQGFMPLRSSETSGETSFIRKYHCAVCGFEFFMNAAASTMALIIKDDQQVLMIRRARDPARGSLDLPGGFVDLGESAEHAMIREVYEETNLSVTSHILYPRTFCNEYLYGGVLYHTLDLVYICEVDDWTNLRSNDPEEGSIELVRLDELTPQQVGLTSVRRFITEYLETRSRTTSG